MSPDFTEPKPDVPVGTGGATATFLAQIIADFPEARLEIVRTIAEGDMVFLHARFTPGPGPGAPSLLLGRCFSAHDELTCPAVAGIFGLTMPHRALARFRYKLFEISRIQNTPSQKLEPPANPQPSDDESIAGKVQWLLTWRQGYRYVRLRF
jgi:hypothetical protein